MRLFGQSTKFLALLTSLSIVFWTIGCANDAGSPSETNNDTETETDAPETDAPDSDAEMDADSDAEMDADTDADDMEESPDDDGDITVEDDPAEAGSATP